MTTIYFNSLFSFPLQQFQQKVSFCCLRLFIQNSHFFRPSFCETFFDGFCIFAIIKLNLRTFLNYSEICFLHNFHSIFSMLAKVEREFPLMMRMKKKKTRDSHTKVAQTNYAEDIFNIFLYFFLSSITIWTHSSSHILIIILTKNNKIFFVSIYLQMWAM